MYCHFRQSGYQFTRVDFRLKISGGGGVFAKCYPLVRAWAYCLKTLRKQLLNLFHTDIAEQKLLLRGGFSLHEFNLRCPKVQ